MRDMKFDANAELKFLRVRVAGELRDTLHCLELEGIDEAGACYWRGKSIAYADVLDWMANIERRREMLA